MLFTQPAKTSGIFKRKFTDVYHQSVDPLQQIQLDHPYNSKQQKTSLISKYYYYCTTVTIK